MLRFKLCALALLTGILPLAAQSISGSMTGTVKDQAGRVVSAKLVSPGPGQVTLRSGESTRQIRLVPGTPANVTWE